MLARANRLPNLPLALLQQLKVMKWRSPSCWYLRRRSGMKLSLGEMDGSGSHFRAVDPLTRDEAKTRSGA